MYKWLKRYDGTWQSLVDISHRPKHSPLAHTEEELKQIRQVMKKYHWEDVILGYQDMCEQYGYTRSYGGFKRVVNKLKDAKENKKRKKRHNKPYQKADYPGQKVQVDVKFVPSECVVDGQKYYQYTAVDEYTRWTYRQMYDEHSTYSLEQFFDQPDQALSGLSFSKSGVGGISGSDVNWRKPANAAPTTLYHLTTLSRPGSIFRLRNLGRSIFPPFAGKSPPSTLTAASPVSVTYH